MTAGERLRIGWRAATPDGPLERWIVVLRDEVPAVVATITADGVRPCHEVRVAIADDRGIATTGWTRTRLPRLSDPLPDQAVDEPGDWSADEARMAAAPATDSEVRCAVARAVAAGAMTRDDAIAVLAALATALDEEEG